MTAIVPTSATVRASLGTPARSAPSAAAPTGRRRGTALIRASRRSCVDHGGHLEHSEPRPVRQLLAHTRGPDAAAAGGRSTLDDLTHGQLRPDLRGPQQHLELARSTRAAIALPATIIPIAFAAFAAYGFAWIDFRGRKPLFIATVALLAIPLQVALIPLLQLYVGGAKFTLPLLDKTITLIPDLDLAGNTTAVWLTHIGIRHAVRHLPAAQLHQLVAEGPVRGGADRRGQPLHHLLADGAPVVGARARRVRHLPVPLDVERLPDRQHDGRRRTPTPIRPRCSSPTSPVTSAGTSTSCRRRRSCRRSSRSRVLRAAAILRARACSPGPSRADHRAT